MPMIIQNRNGALDGESSQRQFDLDSPPGYYAAVPAGLLDNDSSVIDELIGFAFETLGARHLDVRVYDETAARALPRCECAY